MDVTEYKEILKKKRTKPRDYNQMKSKSCNCGKNNNITLPNPHQ